MPRPNVSKARKTQILQAAQRVFARRPFLEATMQEIAQEAGLSIGGVYWYYKSKDEIIAALLQQNAANIAAILGQLAQAAGTARERFILFFDQILAATEEIAGLYLTGVKLYAMTSRDPQMQRAMAEIGALYMQGLSALIQQGIDSGEFRPVDANEAAEALLGLYEGMMLLWRAAPDRKTIPAALKTGAMLILAGLVWD